MQANSARTFLSIVVLSFTTIVAAQQIPSYKPRPVASSPASYLLDDGAVYIVGGEDMRAILSKFNELFARTHPGLRFRMLLKPDSLIAMSGLTSGVSAFAPMDREAWSLELRPFRQLYGYEPTDIRIGRAGYCAPTRACPPGIYINSRNPLTGLTVEQVASIFTRGGESGDFTHWNQLGLKGDWALRAIHVYGPRDDGTWATAIRHDKMGAFPFTRRYEPLPTEADVIKAVANDRYGIALVGFYEARTLPSTVKMLPLAEKDGRPYSSGSYADVLKGGYPFSPFLRLYVNRAPGKQLDPFVKEYLRLVLSREGQAIIAAQKRSRQGYLPLSGREVVAELAKLE